MRFMIIVKATKDSETGVMSELLKTDRWQKLFAEMATYHEELQKAGVLLDAQRTAPELEGLARQVFRREAHRDRRALHRDEGADRRLHADPGEVEGRGDRMGQALPQSPSARTARSRFASCTSWRISAQAITVERFREMEVGNREVDAAPPKRSLDVSISRPLVRRDR